MKLLGLNWRLPLYKRYIYYLQTCRNFLSIIQYERIGKIYQSIEFRNGTEMYFPNISEMHDLFQEIWIGKIYTKYYKNNIPPKTVVDIGANIGTFTLFSQYIWPNSTVFAYEPSPLNYKYLEKNIGDKFKKKINIFNLAVSNSTGSDAFFVKANNVGHSFYKEINTTQEEEATSVVVNTISLANVIEQAGGHIDFLKIDCEGAEWRILPEQEHLLKKIGYIAMEYHIPPNKELSDLVAFFERAGFDILVQPPFEWGTWKLGFLYASNKHK